MLTSWLNFGSKRSKVKVAMANYGVMDKELAQVRGLCQAEASFSTLGIEFYLVMLYFPKGFKHASIHTPNTLSAFISGENSY